MQRSECAGTYVSEDDKVCGLKTCDGGYTYNTGDMTICVSKEECLKDDNRYINGHACVELQNCIKSGSYAYADIRECMNAAPEEDGSFS